MLFPTVRDEIYPTVAWYTPASNDIESFTVLKDASATAIYGSRASNGLYRNVILLSVH